MNRKLLVLLILAVIAIVLYRMAGIDFDWSLFMASLWKVQPGWFVASMLITFITYISRAFRWQVLLNPLKPIPIGPLFSTNLLGFTGIFILGRAGEFIRPLWLTRREQIPLTASVATIIVERFLDTLMLIAMFGWALIAVKVPASASGPLGLMKSAAWVMVSGSLAAIILLFVFRSNTDRIIRYVPFARVRSLLKSFSDGLSFLESGSSLALVVIHSILLWLTIAAQFWLMLVGMNFNFTFAATTLVMVGAAIGSIAQIPGIGGGFQAGYVFCMTTFFMVPAEQAIATSLLAWVSSNIPTVVATSVYMISHGLSLKDLRAATAAQ
jgi:glycosyltransferase 2 family protein